MHLCINVLCESDEMLRDIRQLDDDDTLYIGHLQISRDRLPAAEKRTRN